MLLESIVERLGENGALATGALLIGLLSVLGVNIPAAALGVTFGPTLSRPEETQMIGAYIVFFLFLAWVARFHFLDTILKAAGLRPDDDPAAGALESPEVRRA
jgi:hypothetical protein